MRRCRGGRGYTHFVRGIGGHLSTKRNFVRGRREDNVQRKYYSCTMLVWGFCSLLLLLSLLCASEILCERMVVERRCESPRFSNLITQYGD